MLDIEKTRALIADSVELSALLNAETRRVAEETARINRAVMAWQPWLMTGFAFGFGLMLGVFLTR